MLKFHISVIILTLKITMGIQKLMTLI